MPRPHDTNLVDLYKATVGPIPSGLGGVVIEGVELIDLDNEITGIAGHYLNNLRLLTADHRAWLEESLADLDRIDNQLPDEFAIEYFDRLRHLARYLLSTRTDALRTDPT